MAISTGYTKYMDNKAAGRNTGAGGPMNGSAPKRNAYGNEGNEKAAGPNKNVVDSVTNPASDSDSQESNQIRFVGRGPILPQAVQQAKKDKFNVKPQDKNYPDGKQVF